METLAVVSSITGGASLVAVLYLVYKLVTTYDAYVTARITSVSTASELATTKANLATQTNRADSEKAVADALDSVLADHMEEGPVAGSFERLRLRWEATRLRPADITSTRTMPQPAATTGAGSELMRPGE